MSQFENCEFLLTKMEGCTFNDRIKIPLSPYLVAKIMQDYREKALDAKTYLSQGSERTVVEIFENALDGYKNMRNEYDKHEEEKQKAKKG